LTDLPIKTKIQTVYSIEYRVRKEKEIQEKNSG